MQEYSQENFKELETEELVVLYQQYQKEYYLQEIIHRNNGLLHKWAWEYRNIPCFDEADLFEEGCIALWRAVKSFSISRGFTFTSYLRGCVKQRLNRLCIEMTRQKRYTHSELTSYEQLVEIHKENFIDAGIPSTVILDEFICSLEGKTKYIAIKLSEGYSKIDIADMLNIKPASITYHCKKLEHLATIYFSD